MRIPKPRLFQFAAAIMLAVLSPALLAAQDDGAEAPLGDVARGLRKKPPSSQEVIDNDNLTTVMDQVKGQRLSKASLLYSMDAGGKTFQVSSPDVTCSLSFNANAKTLLSSQYVQMELPASELAKLEGPAIIDRDSLQVSVLNGTDWHVSEVAIALTVIKPSDPRNMSSSYGQAKLIPAAVLPVVQESVKVSEKQPDVTTLYRVRAAAPPAATTILRIPINFDIGHDQEWHWAIVEAKGYPPQRSSQASAAAGSQIPAR